MPKVAIYNTEGGQVGEIDLKEEVFGIKVNETVMHQAVVQYLASRRRGTASVKNRGEVRGGGKKPWRQKGTGRARAGTSRSPLWRSGSVVFGPQQRDYGFRIPKKVRRLALKSALSSKVEAGEIIVVDNLTFSEPKTKEILKVLNSLKADKALVVTADNDVNVVKSARNIVGVKPLEAAGINVYDILNHEKLVITKDAVAKVEEVLA